MKTNIKIQTSVARTFLLTATLAGVSMTGQVSAASACKSLQETACSSNTSCSWIAGYERKDGRQVKSFCRSKPGAKKKTLESASKELVSKNRKQG